MNIKTIYSLALASAALFTACSSDDNENIAPEDRAIRLGVSVCDTRASHTDVSTLTDMGAFYRMKTNAVYKTDNHQFTITGGKLSAMPATMLWDNIYDQVEIAAYTPYNAAATGKGINAMPCGVDSIQTKDSYKNDFLACYRVGNYFELTENKIVNLPLEHKFCEITVSLFPVFENKPITSSDINDVFLMGMHNTGKYDFTTSTFSFDQNDAYTSIKMYNIDPSTLSYRCITVPQTEVLNVAILKGKENYTWSTNQPVTLQPGYRYNVELRVSSDIVMLSGITAEPWTHNVIDEPWYTE